MAVKAEAAALIDTSNAFDIVPGAFKPLLRNWHRNLPDDVNRNIGS